MRLSVQLSGWQIVEAKRSAPLSPRSKLGSVYLPLRLLMPLSLPAKCGLFGGLSLERQEALSAPSVRSFYKRTTLPSLRHEDGQPGLQSLRASP